MSLDLITKSLDGLEAKMIAIAEKAEGEAKTVGKVSQDTLNAVNALGNEQKAQADRLLALEQKGAFHGQGQEAQDDWGKQFTKSASYDAFTKGGAAKASFEVKNTVTNAVGNTFSQRKPAMVGGAFREFTLEQLLSTLPATSSSIDYVRENVFTNAAAETAEGALKSESSITTALVSEPVATIAHFLKISDQLAKDNAALAVYIDVRMRYGVNLRVENQIVAGNGTAPNMSGFTKAGNFTPHGYTAAILTVAGLLNNRFDLIGKMLGDAQLADYPADAIIVNPADWWTMRLAKDSQNRYLLGDPGSTVAPNLFGVPVVSSNAMAASNVFVGNLAAAATFYNREGVQIAMSESDGDNFQRNLITIRAERRCLLAVERPAAMRYGLLVPA